MNDIELMTTFFQLNGDSQTYDDLIKSENPSAGGHITSC
jgi:hypothetical protein